MHHLFEVKSGGGDHASNLIALCPTDHALYHRGTISQESVYAYKAMLVAISRAFDVEAIDHLMFLSKCPKDFLILSGDGVLTFSRLIAADLVDVVLKANNNWQLVTYAVNISAKGSMLIDAWKQGNRSAIANVLARPLPEEAS